jgi:hypothetical protein
MSKVQTEQDVEVFTNFRAPRHAGLVIVWPMGTNKLHLMRIGGPNGSFKMQTKTHASYKTSEGAYNAAMKWFLLLDKIYETSDASKKVTVGA